MKYVIVELPDGFAFRCVGSTCQEVLCLKKSEVTAEVAQRILRVLNLE